MSRQHVEKLAYLLWEKAGRPPGRDREFYLEAERLLTARVTIGEFGLDEQEIELRLSSARVAQERTRIALFANTLVGLCLLAIFWNGYFSIYKDFMYNHYIPLDEDNFRKQQDYKKSSEDNKIKFEQFKKLQEKLKDEWVSSRFITVSLLGIKFGVGDAPELGAIALGVSLLWFFLAVRRENYTIGVLLRDAWNTLDAGIRWKVYHGINSYTVFTNAFESDVPIGDLLDRPGNEDTEASVKMKRYLITLLHFFPLLTIAGVLFGDILISLSVIHSPFRVPNEIPLNYKIRMIFYWSMSVIFIAINAMLTFKIYRFLNSTEKILNQYRKLLRDTCPRAECLDS